MVGKHTKPKVVRISIKTHALLVRLADREQRNAGDVADRLLGSAVKRELAKLDAAERASAGPP